MKSADVLVFDSTEEVSIKMSVELLAKVELIKDDSGYTVARTHVNEPFKIIGRNSISDGRIGRWRLDPRAIWAAHSLSV